MKNYQKWMPVKAEIHNDGNRPIGFKEGEIWWCSLGENIGFEEDGKSSRYTRPVLVYKVYSRQLFIAIPLSTTKNRGKYYFEFEFNGKISVALLSQIRALDSSRLGNGGKIGKITPKQMAGIRQGLLNIL